MASAKYLVTGSTGSIGSWVLKNLAEEGVEIVAGHHSGDFHRVRFLLSGEQMEKITFRRFDVGNLEQVMQVVDEEKVTHIIHLAGLQVPFCAADPARGAWVNVQGTVNILEAARKFSGRIQGLSYASSVAVYGPPEMYPNRPVGDDEPLWPNTLYGIYKMTDEHLARVYWQDWQVASVGIRPAISFGVGRDQGLSSDISKAILAAAADIPYKIKFSGQVCLQFNGDAARAFIAACRAGGEGAPVGNLRNDVIEVSDFVDMLLELAPSAQITYEPDSPLPFPLDLDDARIRTLLGEVPHTPLREAVSESLRHYGELVAKGEIDLDQLN